MSLWTEVFVIHLLPRGLVRLVVRVFTFRAFGGYCLPSANQNYFHICAVRAYAGSSSICKATPTSMYFLIHLRNMLAPKMNSKRSSKSILSFVSMILNGLGRNFHNSLVIFLWFWLVWAPILEYLALWRVSGPPLGHPGVPWGARVPPTRVQGEKSRFVGLPLASQNEVIFA